MALLEVRDLRVWYPVRAGVLRRVKGYIRAVDGVSFEVESGKTVGLVGESGSGKTTIGRAILKLQRATGGRVVFDGKEILSMGEREFRPMRKRMQMVFQDPFGSLNPRLTIGTTLAEPLEIHFPTMTRRERARRVGELLEMVGLKAEMAARYPHEFSGGQRQRICIARALAPKPDFIVCDEAVSALDVSVQAAVLNLLMDLQEELGVAYLFISHDLAVVESVSDEILVMNGGVIVEAGKPSEIYGFARNEYTRKLLSAVPRI
ncbi:MAG: ATP-binding cassette domain-containing protein [Chthoniobacterales bacterium]|nr:ATP-binding cassette domain-containing protein [Chthoniobacterales bacterium]